MIFILNYVSSLGLGLSRQSMFLRHQYLVTLQVSQPIDQGRCHFKSLKIHRLIIRPIWSMGAIESTPTCFASHIWYKTLYILKLAVTSQHISLGTVYQLTHKSKPTRETHNVLVAYKAIARLQWSHYQVDIVHRSNTTCFTTLQTRLARV